MNWLKTLKEIWNELPAALLEKSPDSHPQGATSEAIRENAPVGSNLQGSTSEAERIIREANRRKQRASELDLPSLFAALYHDAIRFYPSWIAMPTGRDHVCSLVTSASKLDSGDISITIGPREYRFHFKENSFSTPDGECHTHGVLDVFLNDQRVLAVNMALEHGEYDSDWHGFNVEAFIEGDWIKDFKNLQKQIEIEQKQREQRQREDPQKLEKLKKDFGITGK